MRRFALLIGLCVGAASCVTPTVPVPPPGPESYAMSLGGGELVLTVNASDQWAGAWVYVRNDGLRTGVIGFTDGAGDATLTLPGSEGDRILVTLETEDGQTAGICLVARDTGGGGATTNDLCP